MPIDPRIPLQAQAPRINTPFENLDVVMQAQQRQQAVQANKVKLDAERRAMEEATAVQRILAESGGDLSDATLKRIIQVAPTVGMKFRADLLEQRGKMIEQTGKEMDLEEKQTQHGLSLLGIAQSNPELWPQVRDMAGRLVGDLAPLLPEHYDPNVVGAILKRGETAKEQIVASRAGMQAALKGDYRYYAGLIANAPDAEEAKEIRAAFLAMGAPVAMLDAMEQNPQAAAMTETERQQAGDRAAAGARAEEAQRITMRGQDLSAETARRGQDISARGQELSAATARRGQDLADKRAATSGAGGAKLSAGAIEKIAGIDQSLGVLESMLRIKDNAWLGPMAGRMMELNLKIPGSPVSKEFARFSAETATLKNSVVKAITGAQMSEPEAKRIMQQIPLVTDKPEVWAAKAEATRENLTTLKRRTIELSGGSVEGETGAPPGNDGWTVINGFKVRVKP